MEIVGIVALGVMAVGVVVGVGLAVLSVPDINRYRKLRKM